MLSRGWNWIAVWTVAFFVYARYGWEDVRWPGMKRGRR